MRLSAAEQAAISALASRAALASALFTTWASLPGATVRSIRSLVDDAQLNVTEENALRDVLDRAVQLGLVEVRGSGFVPCAGMHDRFARLGFALEAVEYYTTAVHKDATVAQVVLTKPPNPSALEKQLDALGWRTSDLQSTQHAFHGLVRAVQKRLVVVTPFFDAAGAAWLQELLSLTSGKPERILVLRSLEDRSRQDYPVGFDAIAPWLKEQGVRVVNYSLPRAGGGGRETFHAKIVLCDRSAAYLGSSNMTGASLEYSMEMGVILRGAAAITVAEVVDAVLGSASPAL